MPCETNAAKRERAIEVCERLNRRYGPVECFLDHEDPFRLLIAVLLSAQTTDAQVNKVTPQLFAQWPTPEAMAGASVTDVADTIKSLGFYKSKAKHAVEAAQMIVADYGGEVPADMKELVKLPGVGRKTANIVLNVGYGIVEGIEKPDAKFCLGVQWHPEWLSAADPAIQGIFDAFVAACK